MEVRLSVLLIFGCSGLHPLKRRCFSAGFKEEAGFLQNPPRKGWWSVLTPSTATRTVENQQLLYGKSWIFNFKFSVTVTTTTQETSHYSIIIGDTILLACSRVGFGVSASTDKSYGERRVSLETRFQLDSVRRPWWSDHRVSLDINL